MTSTPAALRIAAIENDARCPLDRFEEWLEPATITVYRPYLDGKLPELDDADLLIPLGGGQATSDSDRLPWMRDERELLRAAHDTSIPVFGICLGSQLLAEALGGTVEHGALAPGEIGATDVLRNAAGLADPLLGEAALGAGVLAVTSSHGDRIAELPPGAALLASSPQAEVQAFRLASSVGVQFHPEISLSRFEDWLAGKPIGPGMRAATSAVHRMRHPEIEAAAERMARALAAGAAAAAQPVTQRSSRA